MKLRKRYRKNNRLPIFDVKLNDQHAAMIFDTGATTEYLGEEAAKRAGAEIVRIEPRKIRVADKQLVACNTVAKVEMKLGSLTPELITAYVLPMSKIDLILGLP